MNRIYIYLILIIGSIISACEKENGFQFEATVIGKGPDCGETYLINLTNISGDFAITDSTYYADNLSSDLKIDGLKLQLNCRLLNSDEIYICTEMGIAWPHVYVIEAEKAE
jgi:hypothetical protein